jgi:hypothetical protein
MSFIQAYQNRGSTHNITILNVDGDAVTPSSDDKVRVAIGREGQVPELLVTTDGATAHGSTLTRGAVNVLRLDACGVYTMVVEYYDYADAQEWKIVDKHVFVLESEE